MTEINLNLNKILDKKINKFACKNMEGRKEYDLISRGTPSVEEELVSTGGLALIPAQKYVLAESLCSQRIKKRWLWMLKMENKQQSNGLLECWPLEKVTNYPSLIQLTRDRG